MISRDTPIFLARSSCDHFRCLDNNKTDYINGIQYDGVTTPSLTFIQTEEGKAVPNGTGYNYVYYLGDNLGNTRVTFETKTGAAVQTQKDDYYPFGMEISRSVTSPKNEYLYNKKELQEETQEYDYGARFYDPVIARWTTIDPLAEKSRRFSTYVYGENNPIRMIDPDGMEAEDSDDDPGPNDPPRLSSGMRMLLVKIFRPIESIEVGPPTRGFTNISANSERFATSGDSDDSGSVLSARDGNQSNAFRHALWSGTMASQFGSYDAKTIADAHEANPNAINGMSSQELSSKSFGSLAAADESADLANNIIGRQIGASSQGMGMNSIAVKVLNQFAKIGLWTATKQKDGSYKLSMTKITSKQFEALQARFKQLNNNGRTSAGQAKVDEDNGKAEIEQQQAAHNPPVR